MRLAARLGLIAFLASLPTADAWAQQERGSALRVLGGVSAGRLRTTPGTTDAVYGLSLGAQMLYPLGDRMSLVPELLLVEKGGVQKASGIRVNADLRSLDFSFLVRWFASSVPTSRRVYAFAGPTMGYVLRCEAGTGTAGVTLAGDCLNNVKRAEAAVTAGVGLEFPSSQIDWGVSLRYQHGLSDLSQDASGLRTQTVQLLLSYRL